MALHSYFLGEHEQPSKYKLRHSEGCDKPHPLLSHTRE